MQINTSTHSHNQSTAVTASARLSDDKKHTQAQHQPLASATELSSEEEQQLREMKARDREVRAHEQAHKSAAGGLASGAVSFEFETGPDGKQYAVGGEVKIDTSPVKGDPEATARKAEKIQQAANAPAEPSSQDLQVAAQAFAMEQEANAQIRREKLEEDQEGNEEGKLSPLNQLEEESDANFIEKKLGEESDAACAICGGSHSAESHTQTNIEKINQVFELAEVSEGRASVFSAIT